MPDAKFPDYVAFDIGGANIKSSYLYLAGKHTVCAICNKHFFPMWQAADQLKDFFCRQRKSAPAKNIAISITAELSDAFVTKDEGINFILDVLEEGYDSQNIHVCTNKGEFCSIPEARQNPTNVAGANWAASARMASRFLPTGIFVDIGSTTTDLIPFQDNKILCRGYTDPDRLVFGELVYTGALRTPVSHLASTVPYRGSFCRVSPEYFAITGDVHVILGNLGPQAYNWPTPDKRGADIPDAMARLAKVICADTAMLSSGEIEQMARYFYDRQVQQITEALQQVLSRFACPLPILAVGEGDFLAREAAQRLSLQFIDLSHRLGKERADNFSVWALSVLLAELEEGRFFF